MSMSNRIVFLDLARVIALLLVVFGHLYPSGSDVNLYIYAFHMPFFFLVSGYLHRNAETVPLILKMAKRMLVPFCFFIVIGYLYFVVKNHSLSLDTLYNTARNIVYGKSITANVIIWFLLAMFYVRIMGNFFIKHPKYWSVPIILLFVLFVVVRKNYFFLGSAMMAMPFYLAGYYGRRIIDAAVNNRYGVLIGLLCLIATIAISSINGKVSMMGFRFGRTSYEWLSMVLFYSNGIIGSLMLLCFSGLVKKELKIVKLVSRCSISIVGFQAIPIRLWGSYVGIDSGYGVSLLFSVFVVACCVGFHLLVEKKANWLLGGR